VHLLFFTDTHTHTHTHARANAHTCTLLTAIVVPIAFTARGAIARVDWPANASRRARAVLPPSRTPSGPRSSRLSCRIFPDLQTIAIRDLADIPWRNASGCTLGSRRCLPCARTTIPGETLHASLSKESDDKRVVLHIRQNRRWFPQRCHFSWSAVLRLHPGFAGIDSP
jgi:hypothetical protein